MLPFKRDCFPLEGKGVNPLAQGGRLPDLSIQMHVLCRGCGVEDSRILVDPQVGSEELNWVCLKEGQQEGRHRPLKEVWRDLEGGAN